MGDASYVIGIKIHWDILRGILGLSQETYINKILERFRDERLFTKYSFHCERWQV